VCPGSEIHGTLSLSMCIRPPVRWPKSNANVGSLLHWLDVKPDDFVKSSAFNIIAAKASKQALAYLDQIAPVSWKTDAPEITRKVILGSFVTYTASYILW
jgi:hypothetical protein